MKQKCLEKNKTKHVFGKKIISLQVANTLPSNCDRGRSAWRWMESRGWWKTAAKHLTGCKSEFNHYKKITTFQKSTSASSRTSYGCRL